VFLGFCFYLEHLTGALADPARIGDLFAASRVALANGHVARLATASLFHMNGGHLISNLAGLICFLSILEIVAGRARAVIVVVVSGIGGELLSLILQIVPWTVGASSILFGVFGALGALLLLHRRNLHGWFWILGSLWICDLAFLSVAGYVSLQTVDHGAHVGGLISGTIAAVLSLGRRDSPESIASPGRATTVISATLAAVFAAAFLVEAVALRPFVLR
jgi:rhomboid protease GluP